VEVCQIKGLMGGIIYLNDDLTNNALMKFDISLQTKRRLEITRDIFRVTYWQ